MTLLAQDFDTACEAQDDLAMSASNRDFHMAIAAATNTDEQIPKQKPLVSAHSNYVT